MKSALRIILLVFLTAAALCYAPVVSAQDAPKTAKPQAGEGLGAFLLRNGYNVQQYREKFIEINKKRLGKDNSLRRDVEYTLPLKNDSVRYMPLLGKAYQNVKIENSDLRGAVFYLVAGHGGPDPGAMGRLDGNDLCEDEYAYDIILRLARQLLMRDATVRVIIQDPDDGIRDKKFLGIDNHETCEGKPIPLDQIQRLSQRCIAINNHFATDRKNSSYCRAVFVHLDSRSQKEQIDIFLYHYQKSVQGERLANQIRETLEAKYKQHQPNRGFKGTVSQRNLYVLKVSNPPCVFFEMGNIQHSRDQQRFILVDNREAMAKWIAEAIVADFKKNK